MRKRKIIAGIGFNHFVEPNGAILIKIDDKMFTIVGNESRELAPYPCMKVEEKHLLETLKEIVRELELGAHKP